MEQMTFQEIIKASINNLQSGFSATLLDIIISLTLTTLCVLVVIFTYQSTFRGVLFQKSYAVSLGMASLITTLVIIAVSGNLILSLGMVGALSIVRFRTAVKDPLDVVYMFWAISIGIANGVAFYSISITGTIFIAIALFMANAYKSNSTSYLLIVHQDTNSYSDLIGVLEKKVKRYRVRSRIVKSDVDETTIEIKIAPQNIDFLLKDLRTQSAIIDATVVEYSQELSGT